MPFGKIHKKLSKYHQNYVSIQEEFIAYSQTQESLKDEIAKMFDENRLLVEELSKYKSREKRAKSRSIEMVAESMVEENMKLKEKVAVLEREVERMRI